MRQVFIKNGQKVAACLVFLFFLMLVFSCVNESGENRFSEPVETGSASFSIAWHDELSIQTSERALISTRGEGSVSIAQTESDICDAVSDIVCEVYDESDNDLTTASFACSARQGTVDGIPAGQNRELIALGVDAVGDILYYALESNVTITAGQTNDLGTIDAHPFYVSSLLSPQDGAEVTAGDFALTWTPCQNAAGYRIQISEEISFNTLTINETTTGETYYPSGLSESTTYFWQVFPFDSHSNQGAASEEMRRFTVVGLEPCTCTLLPPSRTFSAEGGAGSVDITASAADCQWSISKSADWISITSGSSITGNGAVTYSVSAYTAETQRTATITISGESQTRVHTVIQKPPGDATAPVVTITSPTSGPTASTDKTTLDIGGTASDDKGVIQVTWDNSLGGSGVCTGTTSWSASGIALSEGDNAITVTAVDAAGNTGSDTLTITKRTDGPPTVTITTPTADAVYTSESGSLTIGGSASDDVRVDSVMWQNSLGGSGTCTGTTSWGASGIALYEGENVITVTAIDSADNTTTDILTVTYIPANEPPTVTITSPTSNDSYDTEEDQLDISGTASDDGEITHVTWENNRGGNGTCNGTTSWSENNIDLYEGINIITITAWDNENDYGSDTLSVTMAPSTTPPEDDTPPSVTITQPTSGTGWETYSSSIGLSGTASDNIGVVQVTWENTRTKKGGTCTGTTSWNTPGIGLSPGENNITIRARDAAGNTGTDTIMVYLETIG